MKLFAAVVYKASCWDCQNFDIGKKQNVDYMTEKAIASSCHA